MGIFRRRGFGVIRAILFVAIGAVALYFMFRGIVNDVIITGIK